MLHKIILPALEKSTDKIEVIRDGIGEITGVAEYIFDSDNVLEITGKVFENQKPSKLKSENKFLLVVVVLFKC